MGFIKVASHVLQGGPRGQGKKQGESARRCVQPHTVHRRLLSTGITTPGLRPDLLSGVPETVPLKGLDVVNGTPYLNPAAFPEPPLSPINSFALRVGTAPRFLPNIRGPGHESENMGIIKTTAISEQTNIEFRVEAFNVFNRTGRGDPDTSLGDGLPADGGTFGLITGPMNGPRLIQLSLRLNF